MSLGQQYQRAMRQVLDRLGYDLTFRRIDEGAYDPATGSTGTPTNDDETVRGYFANYEIAEIDGSAIQRGDRKAIISAVDANGAALTKVPQSNDLLIGQGNTVRIVSVEKPRPSDVATVYICQVRE